VVDPLASSAMTWSDLPRTIHYWTSYVTYLIGLCTEEISLAILVPDFRNNIARQFRKMYCKKSNEGLQQEQRQNNTLITSIKVNNFIVGN